MCISGGAPKVETPTPPATPTTEEQTAEDVSPLVIGSKRNQDTSSRFNAAQFGKNALKIALSIPASTGLQSN